MNTWGFETDRLLVGGWHDTAFLSPHIGTLEDLVCDLLTPGVTASLPENWRGRYSKGRAAAWIEDRDAESDNHASIRVLEKCGFTADEANQSSGDDLLFRIVL